jgi:tetratricopeptide (TPR) repeat protein
MGIRNTPDNANFYNNLAMTYNDLKEYDKAQEAIHKAIELKPEDMGFKGNLAFIFTQMGKHEEAVLIYDEVLKVEVNPLAYNNRGYAKLQLGKLEEALEDINTSIKFYPTNAYAFKNRALVYIELKDKEKACQDLEKANELGFSVTYGREVNDLIEEHCKE